jgi:hypothetical protein
MFDDDAARRALQALTDEPAPPATTTLDQVVRRGKRRVLVQRVSSVAAVVAVVAVIGIGTMLLRPDDENGGGVQVGDTPVSTTESMPPPSTTMPLPGWKALEVQLNGDGSCGSGMPEPGQSHDKMPSKERIETMFAAAVGDALGTARLPLEWKKYESSSAFVVIEVGMDNGPGQVQLEIATYGGTPVEAADASLSPEGTCAAPYRRILTDGTVLQLYKDVTFSAKAPAQKLRIFRPDGFMYIVTSAGYSDGDYAASGRDPQGVNPTGVPPMSGRGKLPLTEAQLAIVGLVLAKGIEK